MPNENREIVAARRITDLREAHVADATLENLLALLTIQLDLCSRLPVFEYEASNEGYSRCASLMRDLAGTERRNVQDVLEVLKWHLERKGQPTPAEVAP